MATRLLYRTHFEEKENYLGTQEKGFGIDIWNRPNSKGREASKGTLLQVSLSASVGVYTFSGSWIRSTRSASIKINFNSLNQLSAQAYWRFVWSEMSPNVQGDVETPLLLSNSAEVEPEHASRRAARAAYTAICHFGASLLFGLVTAVCMKVRGRQWRWHDLWPVTIVTRKNACMSNSYFTLFFHDKAWLHTQCQ